MYVRRVEACDEGFCIGEHLYKVGAHRNVEYFSSRKQDHAYAWSCGTTFEFFQTSVN